MAQLRSMTIRTESSRPDVTLAVPTPDTAQALCLGRWKEFDQDYLSDERAAALCAGCPILEACLSRAMTEEGNVTARNRYGVRGGLTPKGRAELAVMDHDCPRCGSREWVWQEVKRGRSYWRCKVCQRERQARRWGRPEVRLSLTETQREQRAQRKVCCALCHKEMHSVSLERHIERLHTDAGQARSRLRAGRAA